MIRIDGSDGGGQLLRTALALSVVTGEAFEMTSIRASRPTPGLKPQHLACVSVAEAVSEASVEGAKEGSSKLRFSPTTVRSEPIHVDVGTAGSTTLVCETVLPVAVALDDPLELTVTGGTDVRWSPPVDYLRYVKRPLCSAFGVEFDLDVRRRGFYPAGGGRVVMTIHPADPTGLAFDSARDPISALDCYSVASESLRSGNVAHRQIEGVKNALAETDVEVPLMSSATYAESTSSGTVVVLVARAGESVVGFNAYGEKGMPAERVGAQAVGQFRDWAASDVPLDRYMADQLLVWVALAGGGISVPVVTNHVRTNIDVIRAFGFDVRLRERATGAVVERVE
ncbi:RNA 3'-terminal phosphate cyclase [Haloferax namakaokahaiae]|uniref:RNA 3'-terminal phosphate cyclase n=1 Tax=Haloferax namakaokahaiae TaxID=1748331 RepID=A0ABD5ZHF1_9EURY